MARFTLIALVVGLITAAAAHASATPDKHAFYLTVKPGQCLIAGSKSGTGSNKIVVVVPCSDPRHQFEVYAIRHGGWKHGQMPTIATVRLIMRSVCIAAYRQITGHQMPRGGGWDAFAPDPGTEQTRYGDKIICSYVNYPSDAPLGAGRHVR
ncbi:MAG TPA: hypothetical protein VGU02_07370 [Gaiellaceae bacterium]|nr:hypothetical protein [Gaiellaceae bacterium]